MKQAMILICFAMLALSGCSSDTVSRKETLIATELCLKKGGMVRIKMDRWDGSLTAFCGDSTEVKVRNLKEYR